VLEVKDLISAFRMESGEWLRAVDGVSFRVPKGKTVGVVGESGCGKSVTAMSIIGLLPKPMGHVLEGEVIFKGEDLTKVDDDRMHEVRGGEIGIIFQEPMTALNPVHRIGKQISEALILHRGLSKREALTESIDLLEKVGIPAPERRVMEYPHQLSGGMRQRVVIAIALACKPDLLIADEPTTALDVTVQSQILELMEDLQNEMGMSTILITHDLGVIAGHCDEVVVMYAGRVVERAPVRELYASPKHAYTRGLLNAIPTLETPRKSRLNTIEGQVASIQEHVPGCRFCQRMERTGSTLRNRAPFVEISKDHWVEACPECVDTIHS
jgi:oligopeptide/dipeptide ABC transporter ATP-binding protein